MITKPASEVAAIQDIIQLSGDIRYGIMHSRWTLRYHNACQACRAERYQALGRKTLTICLALQIAAGMEPEIDPIVARKAAEEAEERRLAEIRSLGTPVTPSHFSVWKKRFYLEMALARSRHATPLLMNHCSFFIPKPDASHD